MRKVELSTALLERVPRSQVLARLVLYLPPRASMMALSSKTEEVMIKAPEPAASPAAAAGDPQKAPPAGAASAAAKKPETIKVKHYVFIVDGLAPTDVEVAQYLSRLSADPLFEEVNLQFSEEFPYKDTIQMRRFQLSFRLSADAEKILEAAPMANLATGMAVGTAAGGAS